MLIHWYTDNQDNPSLWSWKTCLLIKNSTNFRSGNTLTEQGKKLKKLAEKVEKQK